MHVIGDNDRSVMTNKEVLDALEYTRIMEQLSIARDILGDAYTNFNMYSLGMEPSIHRSINDDLYIAKASVLMASERIKREFKGLK